MGSSSFQIFERYAAQVSQAEQYHAVPLLAVTFSEGRSRKALCERIHLKDAHRRCQEVPSMLQNSCCAVYCCTAASMCSEARRGLGEMEASVSHAAEDVVRLRSLQTEVRTQSAPNNTPPNPEV